MMHVLAIFFCAYENSSSEYIVPTNVKLNNAKDVIKKVLPYFACTKASFDTFSLHNVLYVIIIWVEWYVLSLFVTIMNVRKFSKCTYSTALQAALRKCNQPSMINKYPFRRFIAARYYVHLISDNEPIFNINHNIETLIKFSLSILTVFNEITVAAWKIWRKSKKI